MYRWRIRVERSGRVEVPATDGAQPLATPVVPWAQLTMGNPPGGACPPGTTITPDTARSPPAAEVEW